MTKSKQHNLISATRSTDYNLSKYEINFTKKIQGNNSLFSLNLDGGIEGKSDHKVGLTYRVMY